MKTEAIKAKITEALRERPNQSAGELAKRLDIWGAGIYPVLFELERDGKIVHTRWNSKRHTYRLSPE